MSTDSPDQGRAGGNGLRERPFGRTSLAGRSDALFTARNNRGQNLNGEEPNFITDSLNTSFASPSPARPTRIGKPRFAAGNGRTITKQTEQRESRITKSGASPNTSPVRGQQKHVLLRTSTSDRPLPSAASRSPARVQQNGTRTPSPRGRHAQPLISPVSNPSDASPPRGLAESYRRIQDEEFIAGQEGSGSDDGAQQADDQVLRDIVNGELPRHLLSPTPSSRRGSRRPTPQPALDGPGSNKGTPPRSHPLAEDSRHSSPFEEITQEEQEMMRNSLQHERDQKRVSAALDSNAQPFRKARKGTRLGAGLENVHHNDTPSQSESASAGSRNSSQATDPSLNIPSGWGRKARTNKTWLDRVKGDEPSKEQPAVISPSGAISKDEKQDSVAKWAAKTGEEVMDTIESDSFRPDDTEDLARPLNVQASATASAPSTQTETVRLAFSKSRKAKVDALRAREAGEKKRDKLAKQPGPMGRVLDEPNSSPKISHKRKLGSNEPIGLVAPTVTKSKDADRQPAQSKDQSRELLRNLARATSASPSPEIVAERPEADTDKNSEARSTGWLGGVARMFTKDESTAPKAPTHPKVADTPQVIKSKLNAKTPLVTGAWIDTPATKVGTEKKVLQSVSQVKVESLPPAQTQADPQPEVVPTQAIESAPKVQLTFAELQETAPQLRTALADIVAKAKLDRAKRAEGIEVDETLQLDDSTIESLEDLLASSDNSASAPTSSIASVETPEATAKFREQTSKPAHARTRGKQAPEAASESYSRLASRLTHLKTSITDAKEGVGSLQKRLSKSKDVAKPHECSEGGELHDFIIPCEVCGGSALLASDAPFLQWQTIRLPLPRMWYWQRGSRFVPTLTRTGWVISTVLLLLIAELIAVDLYSPPFYADKVVGYGVDIRRPRPPFVLPQLLWQHILGPVLQPIVAALFVGIRALCVMLDMEPGPFGHSTDGKLNLFDRLFWSLRPIEDAADYWRKWQPSDALRAEYSAWAASRAVDSAGVLAAATAAAAAGAAKATAPLAGGWLGRAAGGGAGGWFGAATTTTTKIPMTKPSSAAVPPMPSWAWAGAGDEGVLGMDADEYL